MEDETTRARLGRRYRSAIAGGFAVVAGIAIACPLAANSATASPVGPAHQASAIHEKPGSMGGHGDLPKRLSFSPDGKTVATADNDGTARLWNAATEHQLGKPIEVTGAQIRDAVFSPDSSELVTVDTGGAIRFWDVASHAQLGAPIQASSKKLLSATFSPNGKVLATAGADGSIRLWNFATRHQIGTPMTTAGNSVSTVLFTGDGKLLAGADSDGATELWSVANHHLVGLIKENRDNRGSPQAIALSPDGKMLATADEGVRLFSVATHRQLGKTLHPSRFATNGVAFTPDGKTMITVNADQSIQEWNPTTRHQILSVTVAGFANHFSSAVISPNGNLFGTTSFSGPARLWKLAG